MKLLFCKNCQDVIKLSTKKMRYCSCKSIKGRYLKDGIHAEVSKDAIVIALNNSELGQALGCYSMNNMHEKNNFPTNFGGWVINKTSDRVRWEE